MSHTLLFNMKVVHCFKYCLHLYISYFWCLEIKFFLIFTFVGKKTCVPFLYSLYSFLFTFIHLFCRSKRRSIMKAARYTSHLLVRVTHQESIVLEKVLVRSNPIIEGIYVFGALNHGKFFYSSSVASSSLQHTHELEGTLCFTYRSVQIYEEVLFSKC